jgi:membrane protease YdiL (CAAX protease family)
MSRVQPGSARDLAELIFGYGLILVALWTPGFPQLILTSLALAVTVLIVLARRNKFKAQDSLRRYNAFDGQEDDSLGLGLRGLVPSLWILPAALAFAALSVFVAKRVGTLHDLYQGDVLHISGYVLWTLYQQFLLQDYFMPRLTRLLTNEAAAIGLSAVLFAAAHLPNLPLTVATLIWGAVSCSLFRRYRNLYALGLAQGLLGLCFAICLPDAWHHHLRVGLGYLHYPH